MQQSLKETGRKAVSGNSGSEEFPRTWNFKPWIDESTGEVKEKKDGDYVEGIVQKIGEIETKNGDLVLRLVLDIGEEDVTVWARHAILKRLLEENQVEEGDKIGIEFLGKPKGKNYYTYNLFLEK